MIQVILFVSYVVDYWLVVGGGLELILLIDGLVVVEMFVFIEFVIMVDYVCKIGGLVLWMMIFQECGWMLCVLVDVLMVCKDEFYVFLFLIGVICGDNMFDIDGGIGMLFVYVLKVKLLFDVYVMFDGGWEVISKGNFVGQYFFVLMRGVVVYINVYNFLVWGMFEKFVFMLLVGMLVIVKLVMFGVYFMYVVFCIMIESGVFLLGVVQFLLGSVGGLLDLFDGQDSVVFIGFVVIVVWFKVYFCVIVEMVCFLVEQDSFNVSFLGLEVGVDSFEFDLFVKEVVCEIMQKVGQKCMVICWIMVFELLFDLVQVVIVVWLEKVVVGDLWDEVI